MTAQKLYIMDFIYVLQVPFVILYHILSFLAKNFTQFIFDYGDMMH